MPAAPAANAYVGYQGILNSAVGDSYSSPTPKARTRGAHWLACTVSTYISPPTPTGKYTFREHTSPIEGTLTTDKALLAEGTVCVPNQSGGETVACSAGKGQWLGLAYRPDVKPFISADHQGDYAQSFCQAAADAYGKNRPPWRGFWSTTATEGSGQNCLIALKNFNRAAAPVVLGQSQTKFKTPVETRFATKLTTVGQRLAAEPALMSKEVQQQNLRSSPDYFPTEVQNRTLCKVLSCTGKFSVGTGTAGNSTTFTATVPFEGQSCTGKVAFPLAYLGAPFTTENVTCA